MKRWETLTLAGLFVAGGVGAALYLKANFEDEMSVGGFTTLILTLAAVVIASYGWMICALQAGERGLELSTAQRRERHWQFEKRQIEFFEDKIIRIFTICHMPTRESIPDIRRYRAFRSKLLEVNGGYIALWAMLNNKQVPAVPAMDTVELTDDQKLALWRFVRGTTTEPVR